MNNGHKQCYDGDLTALVSPELRKRYPQLDCTKLPFFLDDCRKGGVRKDGKTPFLRKTELPSLREGEEYLLTDDRMPGTNYVVLVRFVEDEKIGFWAWLSVVRPLQEVN